MLDFKQFSALLLWMHLLTFVQCQKGCTLQAFKESNLFNDNLDPSNLLSRYDLGKSVRVPCQVGFRGFFRLVCSDRGWTSHGDGCRRILCGHPGDVQFADFKLVKGDDYDFGSKVEYTCHKGYQMTSYTSTRNCLQGGWDGHLPECEPIPCPPVTVGTKVVVNGNLNTPTSGSVLQFSCSSRTDELIGPSQIFCDENGNWDKSPPICKAISCSKPPLENFEVEGDKEVYKKDEYLRYSCNFGYRKVDGRPSQCLKVGQSSQWTPMPQCEEITCQLSSTPPEQTKYSPQNKIRFRPNETVTVSCGENYFVKSTVFRSTELKCQITGEWDFEPACKLVTCFRLDNNLEHVDYWRSPTRSQNRWYSRYHIPTAVMDETLEYQCESNYVEKGPTATCTRRGWEPVPLCEEIACPKPELDNFEVDGDKEVYKKNEVLTYFCHPTYRKVNQRKPQCQKVERSSQWTPKPYCEPITCDFRYNQPEGTTVYPKNKLSFRPNETVTVSCGEKHWVKSVDLQLAELKCLDTGKWDFEPVCEEVSCLKQAEYVIHWDQRRNSQLKMDEAVGYRCDENHEEASLTATCIRGGWKPNTLCKEIACPKPEPDNFEVDGDKELYKHNEVLTYSCHPGFRKNVVVHEIKSRCKKSKRSSQWIPEPFCEPIICKLSNRPKGTTVTPPNKFSFRPNETVTVSCGEKHWVKSVDLQFAELKCLDTGKWDFEPVCDEVTCSKHGEHVIYWEPTRLNTVEMDEALRYQCDENHVEASLKAKCIRGGWQPNTLCKEISCPRPELNPLSNFEVQGVETDYNKDEFLRYSCNLGYRKVTESLPQCKKVNGSSQWTHMPQCEPIRCKLDATPPKGTTYNLMNQIVFRPKETVTVSCEEKLWVKSPEQSSAELTCQDNGEWDVKPVCQGTTCKLKPIPPEGTTYSPLNKIDFNPKETVTVSCGVKDFVKSTEFRTINLRCQDNGEWDFEPVCKPVTCNKQDERVYEWQSTESDTVNLGEDVAYRCERFSSSSWARCTRRGWTPKPLCRGVPQ